MNCTPSIGQLHRYNAATIDSVRNNLAAWSAELSTPEHKVLSHFIDVNFEGVSQPQLKLFLNKIPTSFSLTEEQVDTLVKSARDLLKSDPEYQSLLKELAKSAN